MNNRWLGSPGPRRCRSETKIVGAAPRIADYLSRIEKRRWEEGVEKALRDEEYIDEATERSEGGVEIYEY